MCGERWQSFPQDERRYQASEKLRGSGDYFVSKCCLVCVLTILIRVLCSVLHLFELMLFFVGILIDSYWMNFEFRRIVFIIIG